MKKTYYILLLTFLTIHSYSQTDFCNWVGIDKVKSFSVSLGYGTSYGGYGVQSGIYFTPNKKIGVNVGVGNYFGDVFISGGLKSYVWNTLYLNAKYGYFGRVYFFEYDEFSEVVEYKKYLIGPGLFIGYDWFISNRIGLNIGCGLNYDYRFKKEIHYAIDVGVFIGF